MLKEKSCGAIIYRKSKGNIEFLLLKHNNGGHYSFPKGHVECNETETETALREILEETGLTVTLLDDFRECVTYSPNPNAIKDVIYFIAQADFQTVSIQQLEISDCCWVNFKQAQGILSYQNDKQLLKKAANFLQSLQVVLQN